MRRKQKGRPGMRRKQNIRSGMGQLMYPVAFLVSDLETIVANPGINRIFHPAFIITRKIETGDYILDVMTPGVDFKEINLEVKDDWLLIEVPP